MSKVTRLPPYSKTVRLEVEIPVSQRDAFNETPVSIVAGERARMDALDRDVAAITRRVLEGLKVIESAVRENLTSGQGRRLVCFLAGVYNGSDYSFDLTDLRALDTHLANACLDYLNYDRLAKNEVHQHLTGGDQALHQWMRAIGLSPSPRLNETDEARHVALELRSGDYDRRLLHEALENFLGPRDVNAFGILRAMKVDPDSEALRHIRRLSDPSASPLCGATDAPWDAAAFDFGRELCPECRHIPSNAPPADRDE